MLVNVRVNLVIMEDQDDLKSVGFGFFFFFKQLWSRTQQHCSRVTGTERPPPEGH